ncbi:hypothetical protein [Paraburkholderia sp. 22B1P]|uniref:hypothetical protein n=1 Tax=Paraburkholderia sp. 22B1P TaxID=3080498 RepID=UPI00308D9682|nr:hypothetical protein PBP221_17260 [Paraburkholderia sp. 22B1P]
MKRIIFGGAWSISARGIQLNEGGYVCGFTWARKFKAIDIWFKLPLRGSRSYRLTRIGGAWRARRSR